MLDLLDHDDSGDERLDADEVEPQPFDVHRWAEAYLAELPDVPVELVGVPLS